MSAGASQGPLSVMCPLHPTSSRSWLCLSSSSPAETSLNIMPTDLVAPQTGGLPKPVTHLRPSETSPSAPSCRALSPDHPLLLSQPCLLIASLSPWSKPPPPKYSAWAHSPVMLLLWPQPPFSTRGLPRGKCNICLTLPYLPSANGIGSKPDIVDSE